MRVTVKGTKFLLSFLWSLYFYENFYSGLLLDTEIKIFSRPFWTRKYLSNANWEIFLHSDITIINWQEQEKLGKRQLTKSWL